jgi:hypothetical protein
MARIVKLVVRSQVSINSHMLFQLCTVLLRSGSSTSCLWASVLCQNVQKIWPGWCRQQNKAGTRCSWAVFVWIGCVEQHSKVVLPPETAVRTASGWKGTADHRHAQSEVDAGKHL